MQCENNYCAYWENGECILKNISINVMGMCEECVLVTIDEEKLEKARERTRRNLGISNFFD